MITAAHAIIYSANAEADREVLGKILLGNRAVDAGDGWLVIALPPAEVAVHPTDGPPQHEIYLMCDDIETTIADLTQRGVAVESGVSDRGWGLLTSIRLPSGGVLGLYEPRHPVAADRRDVPERCSFRSPSADPQARRPSASVHEQVECLLPPAPGRRRTCALDHAETSVIAHRRPPCPWSIEDRISRRDVHLLPPIVAALHTSAD